VETKTGNLKTKKKDHEMACTTKTKISMLSSAGLSHRARGTIFKVQGPVTTSFEVVEGGTNLAVWNCQITELFLSHC